MIIYSHYLFLESIVKPQSLETHETSLIVQKLTLFLDKSLR